MINKQKLLVSSFNSQSISQASYRNNHKNSKSNNNNHWKNQNENDIAIQEEILQQIKMKRKKNNKQNIINNKQNFILKSNRFKNKDNQNCQQQNQKKQQKEEDEVSFGNTKSIKIMQNAPNISINPQNSQNATNNPINQTYTFTAIKITKDNSDFSKIKKKSNAICKTQYSQNDLQNIASGIKKIVSQKQKSTTELNIQNKKYRVIPTKEYSNKFLRQTQPHNNHNGSKIMQNQSSSSLINSTNSLIRPKAKNSILSIKSCLKSKKKAIAAANTVTNKENYSVRMLTQYDKQRYLTGNQHFHKNHKKTLTNYYPLQCQPNSKLGIDTPSILAILQNGQKISTSRALQLFSKVYKKNQTDKNTNIKYRKNFILKSQVQTKKVKLQQKIVKLNTKIKPQRFRTQSTLSNTKDNQNENHQYSHYSYNSSNKNKYNPYSTNSNYCQENGKNGISAISPSGANTSNIFHNKKIISKRKKNNDFTFELNDDDGFAIVGWQDQQQ